RRVRARLPGAGRGAGVPGVVRPGEPARGDRPAADRVPAAPARPGRAALARRPAGHPVGLRLGADPGQPPRLVRPGQRARRGRGQPRHGRAPRGVPGVAAVRLDDGQRGDVARQDRPGHRGPVPRARRPGGLRRAGPRRVRPHPEAGARGDRPPPAAGEPARALPCGAAPQPLRGRAEPPAAPRPRGAAGGRPVRDGARAPVHPAAAQRERRGGRPAEHRLTPVRPGRPDGPGPPTAAPAGPYRRAAASGRPAGPRGYAEEVTESPYTDLDRPPLSAAALQRALVRPGSLWSSVTVVARTGSTNADLAEAARQGAAEGTVLVAEVQSAGRGRLGRTWTAPPRAGLTFSVLLRPTVRPARQGWLMLLAGLAAASAIRRIAQVDVRLKWPNDLLVGERKLGGVLAERVDGAVVVGIGINVTLRPDELPVEQATSLAIEKAACTDRDPLLRAILRELESHYRDWTEA